ncbi:MAG TPA: metallophosphoesterase family protein [Longimicrobiales bacterium]|nr:metallophosphoesterase family protein [Longimicrobiales bacterium]
MTKIGIISDTHGRIPARALEALRGVDRILHAGDIGDPGLLAELEAVAPVTAVHGNMDGPELRDTVPAEAVIETDGRTIVLMHGDALRDQSVATFRAARPEADMVVHGHTHRVRVERDELPWVVNPGSAGDPRKGDPPTVAIVRIEDGEMEVDIVAL